ncbi:hypothetical protein PLESTF_001055800 [Pleodorina starrii]|nr:hypothetical protein PLESTM_001130700 [Pleodorina starrii]GLC70965.1 hypothetical protein PLESTF_001055800 [Pleodorina starrii]
MDLGNLDLGPQPHPPTWVAFEATTQNHVYKPKRRKGARGRATGEEMAAMVESGGKILRREQHLRPEQIEALRLKREPKDHSVACLEQEDGEGNVEYKYRIKDPHPVRLQQLVTQMKYRLSEGDGECFYYIGIEDNGYPKGLEPAELDGSIATLHRMADHLGAFVTLLHYLPAAWGRRAALLRVANGTAQEACHTDLRIAVAGSVDAGKSTLVAVLTHGSGGRPLLDNGRGLARMNVFRHKHEMQSGRTSSICHQLLGYDRDGRVINYATPAATALTPAEVTGSAAKVLTFLDMGGHEKYLKTALYGMTALLPDFGLLCVCAVAGLGRIAREHLAVAVALEVPVAVIITKVEMVTPERFAAVLAEVRQLVALTMRHESGPGAAAVAQQQQQQQQHAGAIDPTAEERRVEDASPLINTEAEARASASVLCQLHADSLATSTARGALRVHMPIFAVSAVTGTGLPVLHAFLNALQPAAPVKGACSGSLLPTAGSGNGAGLSSAASAPASASASAGADSSCDGADSSCCGASAGGSPRAAVTDGGTAFDSLDVPAMAAAAAAAAAVAGPQQQLLYAPAAAAPAVAVTTTAAAAAAPAEAQAVHFQVDGTFEVEGVGSVVSGTLVSGMVRVGQELLLGPTAAGDFTRVVVRQLQRSHVQVKQVRAGQTCTIAISPATVAPATAPPPIPNGVSTVNGVEAPPLGSSTAAGPVATSANGKVERPIAGLAVAAAAASVSSAVNGGRRTSATGFEDALAAAQTALELCLAGDSDNDAGGGGADDDLFGFDVSDGPASPTPSRAGRTSPRPGTSPQPSVGAGSGAPFLGSSFVTDGVLPTSMSVCQLHSTTSFGAGNGANGGGGGPLFASALSTSAPAARTLSSLGAAQSPFAAVSANRKGAVLLEPALQPRTSWTFEAVLILLGGHWPPRGLVSGRWPPVGDDEVDAATEGLQLQLPLRPCRAGASASASAPELQRSSSGSSDPATSGRSGSMTPAKADAPEAVGWNCDGAAAVMIPGRPAARSGAGKPNGRRRNQRAAGAGAYVTVIHCGSVRQLAHVLVMQELMEDGIVDEHVPDRRGAASSPYCFPDLRISASTRAAAALLQNAAAAPAGHSYGPGQPHAQVAAAAVATGPPALAPLSPPQQQQQHCLRQPPDHDLGCLVRVVFRWQHRPEWLREGAKLLVRDRGDGRVAGAGFVRRMLF